MNKFSAPRITLSFLFSVKNCDLKMSNYFFPISFPLLARIRREVLGRAFFLFLDRDVWPQDHSLQHLFDSFIFCFISVPCGYLDTKFPWVCRQSFAMEPWLASNSKQSSCLSFLGVGIPGIHYLLRAWYDISLNSLFRSRWITWEEKLFCLFLPIVQSILNNLHVSIGHVVRCLT